KKQPVSEPAQRPPGAQRRLPRSPQTPKGCASTGTRTHTGGSMIFINCQQGTAEWFAARAGIVTASKFADAISTLKNGSPSQASKDYAYKVAIERIYGETTEDTYQTFEMRRGTELEPLARIAYEARTGNLAEESGIVLTDD